MESRIRGLDGLRAVAVVAVLAFHLQIPGFGAGSIGVDVFFVLSGYLITALLMREVDQSGRINLPRFWLRRLARLYPALLTAALLALVAGQVRVQDAAWSVTYLGNVPRSLGFDIGWLGHTWSLAVEEQFYLAWPVLLLVLHRFGKRRAVATGCIAVAISSLSALLLVDGIGAAGALGYNSPATRIWEPLTGGLLAICWCRALPKLVVAMVPYAIASAALVAIVITDELVGESVLSMLLATGLSMVLIPAVVSHPGFWAAGPLVWIGRRSYGVYLYHFPVLGLCAAWSTPARTAFVVVATSLLALTSYALIERPVQRWAYRRQSSVQRIAQPTPIPNVQTDPHLRSRIDAPLF